MTRKNYIAIAKIFHAEVDWWNTNNTSHKERVAAKAAVKNIIYDLAKVLAEDNPRFKTEKFYKACGF